MVRGKGRRGCGVHNDNNIVHERGLLLFQIDGLGFAALEFCTKQRIAVGI